MHGDTQVGRAVEKPVNNAGLTEELSYRDKKHLPVTLHTSQRV